MHEILLPDKKELSFIPLPENGPWCPIAVFIEDAVEDGTASDDDKDGGDENICCSNGDISNLLHNTNNMTPSQKKQDISWHHAKFIWHLPTLPNYDIIYLWRCCIF